MSAVNFSTKKPGFERKQPIDGFFHRDEKKPENSERHRKKIRRCCAFTKDTDGWLSFGDSQNGPVHQNLQQKPAKIRPKVFHPSNLPAACFVSIFATPP